MKYIKLGSSDLQVSQICLGSMTWGVQNTQSDAFLQLDYAVEQGINFIDTAELYPIPPSADTYGLTERYIGNWLANTTIKRDEIILMSKISGPGVRWVRGGTEITGKTIKTAIEGSLNRLQTDYIDVYQLHWPNRPNPHFGNHWPGSLKLDKVDVEQERDNHFDILTTLGECIKAGKIRHCGLSNDTPWGINQYLRLAEQHELPKMVSIQNEFNLLHLKDSPFVFEPCALEDIAYLPWSPLAGGALSGKYRNGKRPERCRWTMQQRNGIFRETSYSHQAIDAYFAVAQKAGLSLTQMSLAWVYQFSGVSATIIGATSMEQLQENIEAYKVELSNDTLADIDRVIRQYPVPF